MSNCRRGAEHFKAVSLLWRVTEQSDGPHRPENNSYRWCTQGDKTGALLLPPCTPPHPLNRHSFPPSSHRSKRTLLSSLAHLHFTFCAQTISFLSLTYACIHIYSIFFYNPQSWFHMLAFFINIRYLFHHTYTVATCTPVQSNVTTALP